jgi:hypothetical protein
MQEASSSCMLLDFGNEAPLICCRSLHAPNTTLLHRLILCNVNEEQQ